MRRACIILLPGVLLAFSAFAGGKEESSVQEQGGMEATLDCFGYGYKVKVVVNGVDVNVKGGKSESKRLFDRNNPLVKEVPPEMKNLFILKLGENQIQVEFTKQGTERDKLTLSLQPEGYPAPVFVLHSKSKAAAKVESKFTVEAKAPGEFRPVYVSDEGENKSALVALTTMNATLTPFLNGQEQMTLAGMPGLVPLENVKAGKNELVVKYQADPAETRELRFAVVTPEGAKFLVRKITDKSAKEETFSFTVQ
jgi:hypothetical protein